MRRILFLSTPLLLFLIFAGYCYSYRATREQPIVYQAPGAEAVRVEKDLVWADLGRDQLRMDLYRPPTADGPLPIVVFVHGDGPASVIKDFRGWGQMTSWARNTAASGMAAVTFDHTSTELLKRSQEVAQEIDAFLDHLRDEAPGLGLDPDRICVWSCSSAPPFAWRQVLEEKPEFLRCLVGFYGALSFGAFPPGHTKRVDPEVAREFDLIRYLDQRPEAVPPIFLAKGAEDSPALNELIDAFARRARELGISVEVETHETGRHAFDLGSDDQRSREIILRTLEFLQENLRGDPKDSL